MFLGEFVCNAADVVGKDQMWNRGDNIVHAARGNDTFISNSWFRSNLFLSVPLFNFLFKDSSSSYSMFVDFKEIIWCCVR